VTLHSGNGSAAMLARKLKSAGLACGDFREVPQATPNIQTFDMKDIGNCGLGHIGVFGSASGRDGWVDSQLGTVKMTACAEGVTWAVCLFPGETVTKAQVEAALKDVRTT
jgi:hypothetical protein